MLPTLALVLSISTLGGCATSASNDDEQASSQSEIGLEEKRTPIQDLTKPSTTFHLTVPNTFECGVRLQFPRGTDRWNLASAMFELAPKDPRVKVSISDTAILLTMPGVTAWDVWFEVTTTKDGQSLADMFKTWVPTEAAYVTVDRCPLK